MKKQTLVSKLHRPVHPTNGKAVLGAGLILAMAAVVLVLKQQSVSPTSTRKSSLPPTPTSVLAQSANVTPTLLPTDAWKTYTDWNCSYPYSIKLPPEFSVNDNISFKCDTALNASNNLYAFTVWVGYSWGTDANTTPPSCLTNAACYDF